MDLNARCRIIYFMIITVTSPLYSCLDYYDGFKLRAQKIQEYGEKLSSVEEDGDTPYKLGRQVSLEKSDAFQEDVNEKILIGELQVTENDQEYTTIAFSTKCTTDKNIKLEDEYKPETSKENSREEEKEEEEKEEEETVVDGKPLKKEDSSEEMVNVTKVYHPPKPTKLQDHYIDDV